MAKESSIIDIKNLIKKRNGIKK